MADEAQNFPSHPGDAWLEEALLLAAAELATFRSVAQTERQRSQEREQAAQAQVATLEALLQQRADAHRAELSAAQQLDEQLQQREHAWAQFSAGLRERLAHLAAASEQHAHDVEEASDLRRQLHASRGELKELRGQHAELERRLASNEEALGLATSALHKTRDEAAAREAQCGDLQRELSASAAHCARLQTESRATTAKLSDAESLRARLEDELRALALQLRDTRSERDGLASKAEELARLRVSHSELEAQLVAQSEELARRQSRVAELAHASLELEALRVLHGEVELRAQTLRSELDEAQPRADQLPKLQSELRDLRTEHQRVSADRAELREQLADAHTQLDVLEALQTEAAELRDAVAQLEQQSSEQQRELQAGQQSVAEALERTAHADKRLMEVRAFEEVARTRIQEAEADVHAARRERDQVRKAAEARLREMGDVEGQLAEARAELSEQTQTRWVMLDLEKQRTAKLKSELEQARAELGGRAGRSGSSESQSRVTIPPPPDEAGPELPNLELPAPGPELTNLLSGGTLRPANELSHGPVSRAREGTAYSFSELAEEQIVVPVRMPSIASKAPGGGRGTR